MPATASASPNGRRTSCACASWQWRSRSSMPAQAARLAPPAPNPQPSVGRHNVERELLLEIGCEEIPAGWLPSLTNQIGEVVVAALREHRLEPGSPAETYSTPRRLTVRILRLAERQTDLEELVNGPPVSASFRSDGTPTPAATGFAAKNGVEVHTLERVETAKGVYLAFRRRQRGKAAVDVLPSVLGGTLRALAFPKSMQWDAMLEDGRGSLPFGRPIRWILFTYGGRVVPFTIARTPAAQTAQVQEVASGAVTYGHRFLTTSGRAGRAIKVRSFDEYRARLLENFVILERAERHNKIARELDAKAQRLQGRVSRAVHGRSGLLDEVPDLVEYPSVVAGTFAIEFLELPEEVLTTTLIHHQHYFPVDGEDGRLKNAFLAVINTEPDNERTIARNAERVVTARLRDARFFWEADRQATLESRLDRLGTLLFHKRLGTYQEKARRIERLAGWIAREALGASAETARHASQAARLAKADLTTDMVRELTELQGTMGGIYAREEGLPEEVWKAIYFQYLPVGVEADAAPSRAQLGNAAVTWAAVSLADKLDTVVGLFAAGEKPTGSRDPFGLRRAAQGIVRLLADLEPLCGVTTRPALGRLIEQAYAGLNGPGPDDEAANSLNLFMMERLQHVMRTRGLGYQEIQVVTSGGIQRVADINVADLIEWATEWKRVVGTPEFEKAAEAYKRASRIVEAEWDAAAASSDEAAGRELLVEPAEIALRQDLNRVSDQIEQALKARQPGKAVDAVASIQPAITRFFDEVRVMVPDQSVTRARLSLLREFRDAVSRFGDPSVLASKPA
ncbi:MAG: glycine--tRNA ligase subunit beta [Luteitalea sp.]|nr:glycine--tRNA ligase subunit beta [Luteitalea sp.]